MFENPRKYFIENVLPNYSEYTAHQVRGKWGENQLLRKGINTCVALYHVREHLPDTIKPSRADLTKKCPDYGILGDIVNVSKHKTIDRNNPSVIDASQLSECKTITYYEDEQGEYTAPRQEVHVRLNDGTVRLLSDILHNVMSMWNEELSRLGVLDFKAPEPPNDDSPVSREEAELRNAGIEIRQGEEYTFQFQLRKYNYTIMRPEPMDLSGKSVHFRMFKPEESAEIEIRIPNIGLTVDYRVPLTPEQSIKYTKLHDEGERNKFLQHVINTNQEIQKDLDQTIAESIKKQKDA